MEKCKKCICRTCGKGDSCPWMDEGGCHKCRKGDNFKKECEDYE